MQTVRTPAHYKQLNFMNNPVVYDYKGSQISFSSGENVMINATQMAKSFGKRTNDFLTLKQTCELISSLSVKTGIPATGLIAVNQGGTNQGTWMHEDLALIFAQWLSPDFYLWCNDRIKELLKYGMTATQPTLEQMVSNPDLIITLATQLKAEREEKSRLEQQNQLQSEQLRLSAPKIQYVDNVLQSVNTYTSTQMAKELGMREAEQLHKVLKEKEIMFKQSGQWMLTAKYSDKGYTKTRTSTYTRSDGSQGTNSITVWTELGRAFLHKVFTGFKKAS